MLKNKRGFTLIEVLVVLLITSILLGVIYMVFNQSVSTFTKEESRVENQQSLRQAALVIEKDIRESDQQKGSLFLEADGCYRFAFHKYCLVGNSLMRDGSALASNVAQFTMSESASLELLIKLESVPDRYQQVVTIETQVTLRGERSEEPV